MSIDLDWLQLSSLSNRLVEALNRHLQSADRPSFIGPITINSFEFGTVAPDVELVDVRDVYRDFLQDDEDDEEGDDGDSRGSGSIPGDEDEYSDEYLDEAEGVMPRDPQELRRIAVRRPSEAASPSYRNQNRNQSRSHNPNSDYNPSHSRDHNPNPNPSANRLVEDEDFEWVSRRGTGRGLAEQGPGYHLFPPHVRYGGGPATSLSGAANPFDYTRSLSGSLSASLSLLQARKSEQKASESGSSGNQHPKQPHRLSSEVVLEADPTPSGSSAAAAPVAGATVTTVTTDSDASAAPVATPSTLPPTANDLQLHLRVVFNSDIRISITTSLLLNYPSPMFMALPVRLSIVGFEFNGEVVVAYQGSRKRVHLCILDDEDPYRPASASDPATRVNTSDGPLSAAESPNGNRNGNGNGGSRYYEKEKKESVGLRLLPHIFIESEIGQGDKQVLRNVSRVEKFIQDMVRSTLEDELVFPNFHTIVYGDENEA